MSVSFWLSSFKTLGPLGMRETDGINNTCGRRVGEELGEKGSFWTWRREDFWPGGRERGGGVVIKERGLSF